MPTYHLNRRAVRKAEELIDAHQYDLETPWSDASPTAAEGNDQIERHGFDGYGAWHLAVNPEASEETKERYAFPYGDFHRVNRAALIHAKQRASQRGHEEIEREADKLLGRLDHTHEGSD